MFGMFASHFPAGEDESGEDGLMLHVSAGLRRAIERCLDGCLRCLELIEDVGIDVSSDTLAGWKVQNRSFVLPEEDVRSYR